MRAGLPLDVIRRPTGHAFAFFTSNDQVSQSVTKTDPGGIARHPDDVQLDWAAGAKLGTGPTAANSNPKLFRFKVNPGRRIAQNICDALGLFASHLGVSRVKSTVALHVAVALLKAGQRRMVQSGQRAT
jgi:hypothetical protein